MKLQIERISSNLPRYAITDADNPETYIVAKDLTALPEKLVELLRPDLVQGMGADCYAAFLDEVEGNVKAALERTANQIPVGNPAWEEFHRSRYVGMFNVPDGYHGNTTWLHYVSCGAVVYAVHPSGFFRIPQSYLSEIIKSPGFISASK